MIKSFAAAHHAIVTPSVPSKITTTPSPETSAAPSSTASPIEVLASTTPKPVSIPTKANTPQEVTVPLDTHQNQSHNLVTSQPEIEASTGRNKLMFKNDFINPVEQ